MKWVILVLVPKKRISQNAASDMKYKKSPLSGALRG